MKIKWKTRDGGWNPYIAGGLAGILAVVSAVNSFAVRPEGPTD